MFSSAGGVKLMELIAFRSSSATASCCFCSFVRSSLSLPLSLSLSLGDFAALVPFSLAAFSTFSGLASLAVGVVVDGNDAAPETALAVLAFTSSFFSFALLSFATTEVAFSEELALLSPVAPFILDAASLSLAATVGSGIDAVSCSAAERDSYDIKFRSLRSLHEREACLEGAAATPHLRKPSCVCVGHRGCMPMLRSRSRTYRIPRALQYFLIVCDAYLRNAKKARQLPPLLCLCPLPGV